MLIAHRIRWTSCSVVVYTSRKATQVDTIGDNSSGTILQSVFLILVSCVTDVEAGFTH